MGFITIALTTPGRQFSASKFGPSRAAGVEPPDESDDESGDDGMELFSVPILAVINWRKNTKHNLRIVLSVYKIVSQNWIDCSWWSLWPSTHSTY